MEIDASFELLKKDVAAIIKRAQAGRKDDRRKAAFIAIYMGVVSAITTVCIEIVTFVSDKYSNLFGIVSLLSSASVTVVAAWDGIFHHKKLWINWVVMLNELYELENDIRHTEATSNVVTQEQINTFYSRYKKIMRDTNERWYKIRD